MDGVDQREFDRFGITENDTQAIRYILCSTNWKTAPEYYTFVPSLYTIVLQNPTDWSESRHINTPESGADAGQAQQEVVSQGSPDSQARLGASNTEPGASCVQTRAGLHRLYNL